MRQRTLGRTLAEPVHPAYRSAIRSARCEEPGPAHPGDVNDDTGVLRSQSATRESQATGRPFSSSHHLGNQPSATSRCPGIQGTDPGQLRP